MPDDRRIVDQPRLKRTPWRFSLRELLLLMLAIAAFLGWGRAIYKQYLPFRPTRVQEALNFPAQIDAIRRQIGETDFSYFSSSTSGGGDGRSSERTYRYEFPLSDANFQAFASRLVQHAEASIASSGCQALSSRRGFSSSEFRENAYRYQRGGTAGTLRLILMKRDGGKCQILLFLDERLAAP